MAKRDEANEKKGLMNFLSNQKWIANLEKKFEKQIKTARDSFDKNLDKARKGLNITTKRDINAINTKLRALEKRIDKLEGAKKRKSPKAKATNQQESV